MPLLSRSDPRPTVRCYARVWIVIRSNGERFLVEREPLEGIVAWAAGQDVTVIEYTVLTVVHPVGATALPL